MPDFGLRWKNPRELGKGGQGLTYLVDDASDGCGTCVAKILKGPTTPERIQRFEQEIAAAQEFGDCPYVAKVLYSGKTVNKAYPYFVMPHYTKGTLEENYDQLGTPLDRLRVFHAICVGVEYAHSKGLIHRDLKPANIFMENLSHPVVGDFGLCYRTDGDAEERMTRTSEAVGARKYIPPEWRDGRVDNPNAKGDVYSLGKVLYWLFQGGVHDGHEDDHVIEHPVLKTAGVLQNEAFAPQAPERWIAAKSAAHELVSQTVLKKESDRLDSVTKLKELVEAAIGRIERGGRVLDFNLPKICLFCGQGTYQIPRNLPIPTRENRQRNNEDTRELIKFVKREFGIQSPFGKAIPIPLVCHLCGNIQHFRLDLTQDGHGGNWNP